MKDCVRALADEALLLCGVDFRLHGRDADNGVDCVGLADLCVSAAGLNCDVPTGYSIRGGDIATVVNVMEQAGFKKILSKDAPREGDLILVRPSPAQLHLMICTQGGFVHAHAGLRKVVFSPGPCPWPIFQIFRFVED